MSISASILGDIKPGASKWSAICTSLFLQCVSLQELFSDSGYAVTASMPHHRLLHSRLFSTKMCLHTIKGSSRSVKDASKQDSVPGPLRKGSLSSLFDTL